MSEELKNCPFCGGADKHDADCYIPMLVEYVERKLFLEPDDENKLEEAWNTRAERTCKATYPNDSDYRTVPIPRCSECRRPIIEYEDGGLANYCHYCGAKVIN